MEAPFGELEFAALRATIRERGTVRLILTWATFVAWAALLVATVAWTVVPAAVLVPLLVLAAGFETTFAIHTGVERVGRYLQVFYEKHAGERAGPRGWETMALRYGQRFAGGPDPLFSVLFVIAAVLNYFPVMGAGVMVERVSLGVFHALVVARVIVAQRRAARQRDEDLERFRSLRDQQNP